MSLQALPILTGAKPTGYQMSAQGVNAGTNQLHFAVTCATDGG
jgi:hypothetical protein